MMSVHMGTENDLKQVMQKKGMKVSYKRVVDNPKFDGNIDI